MEKSYESNRSRSSNSYPQTSLLLPKCHTYREREIICWEKTFQTRLFRCISFGIIRRLFRMPNQIPKLYQNIFLKKYFSLGGASKGGKQFCEMMGQRRNVGEFFILFSRLICIQNALVKAAKKMTLDGRCALG